MSFVGTRRDSRVTSSPSRSRARPRRHGPVRRNVGKPVASCFRPTSARRGTPGPRRILRRERADVAVGMGGYTSIPLIAGARLARVPSLIHESGAVAGRANQVAARLTRNVATAFDVPPGEFPAHVGAAHVGMPLGPRSSPGRPRRPPRRGAPPSGWRPTSRCCSSTAAARAGHASTTPALGLARRWRDRDDVHIVIKAGRANVDDVERRLKELAEVVPRASPTWTAWTRVRGRRSRRCAGPARAPWRSSRWPGCPAVLVPYPFAPDDHQARQRAVLVAAARR